MGNHWWTDIVQESVVKLESGQGPQLRAEGDGTDLVIKEQF